MRAGLKRKDTPWDGSRPGDENGYWRAGRFLHRQMRGVEQTVQGVCGCRWLQNQEVLEVQVRPQRQRTYLGPGNGALRRRNGSTRSFELVGRRLSLRTKRLA